MFILRTWSVEGRAFVYIAYMECRGEGICLYFLQGDEKGWALFIFYRGVCGGERREIESIFINIFK